MTIESLKLADMQHLTQSDSKLIEKDNNFEKYYTTN